MKCSYRANHNDSSKYNYLLSLCPIANLSISLDAHQFGAFRPNIHHGEASKAGQTNHPWFSLTACIPARQPTMIDPKILDDISSKVSQNLPKGLQAMQNDLQHNLRSGLESALAKLNLVTREEFDVQAAVLARTRAKLEALEKQVAELEKILGNK